jgi:signal transduction histidine kinase
VTYSLADAFALLRPEDEILSQRRRSRIGMYRFGALLGAALILLFGIVQRRANPAGFDPIGTRLAAAGVLAGLFLMSYISSWLRRRYVASTWAFFHLYTGWVALLAAENHFDGDYAVELVFAQAALGISVGLGARSTRPVLWFFGTGTLLAAGALFYTSDPEVSPLVVIGGIVVVALIESAALEGRLAVENDLSRQREKLEQSTELNQKIAEISAELVDASSGRLDRKIEKALGTVGSFVEADRSYVFLYGQNPEGGNPEEGPLEETSVSNTHEWCAGGVSSQKENLQSIPCSQVPWWTRQMEKKEPLLIPSVSGLPEAASAEQKMLEAQGIESLVVLPMTRGGELIGFVGFDASEERVAKGRVAEERAAWSEQTVTVLQVLSDSIANALHRRKAEKRLRETRDYYRQVLNQLPVELAIFDSDGRIEHVNPNGIGDPEVREWARGRTNEEYCRRRGLSASLGRRRDEAIQAAAEDKTTVRFGETIADETTETEEGRLYYRRVLEPLIDLEGKVMSVVGCGLDITERVRSQKELKRAKKEAEQARREAEEASRAKSAFLANMSHEIRTPLTSVIGFAETIGEDSSKASRFAPLIEKSGKRLLKTLNGVLNLSKLQAGQMQLAEEPVDVTGQARRAAEEHAPQAESSGVDLSTELPGSPVWAKADEGGVQIALQNLISNAIKYAEGEAAWVRVYEEESWVVLEVEDTGIGMEPKAAEGLFEPFRQASEGLSREYEGSGVGLAVTKEAVGKMGGSIEVETEKGEGSRFILRLPSAERGEKRGKREA